MKKIIAIYVLSLIFSMTTNLKTKNTNNINNPENNVVLTTRQNNVKRLNNSYSTVSVTFDCNGGLYDDKIVSFQQTIISGSLLDEPDKTKMTRENASFDCWCTLDGKEWKFEETTVIEDTVLRAKWNWNSSVRIENMGSISYYLSKKYYLSSNWHVTNKKSMKNVSGHIPVEVGGNDNLFFPDSDIQTAIETSGIASSYGGCGPIAMMGIMDYFARYENYTSIMNDPTNSNDRIRLAYEIFKNTKTSEVGFGLQNEQETMELADNIELFSGGNKSTLTFPDDYANGFNTLMANMYHLDKQIVAKSQGWLFVSKASKINKIKQSIDAGLPVTIYAGQAGSGYFGNHYVNAYEYEVWEGLDRDGKVITNTVFNTRLNWGWGQDYECHMDSDMLSALFSGVIYYTVSDNHQIIRPIDFANDFVNDNGQGQYFFYEKTKDITTADGFTFGTTRLRCGYIENEYLVLSSKRANVTEAYLKFDFNMNVKAINFDICLWSGLEGLLDSNSSITLQIPNENGEFITEMNFLPSDLSTLKENPNNYYCEFSHPTNSFKFVVKHNNPSGNKNKGRVVLGDINIFY